jgi:hypothetical protein
VPVTMNIAVVSGVTCGLIEVYRRSECRRVNTCLRFEVPAAVTVRITVVCDVTSCGLVEVSLSFVGTCCLHLQGSKVDS